MHRLTRGPWLVLGAIASALGVTPSHADERRPASAPKTERSKQPRVVDAEALRPVAGTWVAERREEAAECARTRIELGESGELVTELADEKVRGKWWKQGETFGFELRTERRNAKGVVTGKTRYQGSFTHDAGEKRVAGRIVETIYDGHGAELESLTHPFEAAPGG